MSLFRTAFLMAAAVLLACALASPPAGAASGDITLIGQLTIPNAQRITDVWGWVDTDTGKEYALVGDWNLGVHVVDISDPTNPTYVVLIAGVPGFDVKAYDNYVYVCDGNASGSDSRIIDIDNPAAPIILPTTFQSCHNIAISPGGTMYLEYSGLTAFDLSVDPTMPDSLWRERSNGHDSTPKDDRLYDFTGWDDTMKVWDVTTPASPVLIGTITDPAISYFHSGDVTDDHNYLYICDEVASDPQPDIIVYDISNLASPVRLTDIADPSATMHNLYIIGDYGFAAHYTAGFKVIDVSNPASPVVADEYDTSGLTGEGYDGAFGVYPYSPEGHILVSDHPNGLFIFSVEGHTTPIVSSASDAPAVSVTLSQNYPNPFNPTTTISFDLGAAGDVALDVFDVGGRHVRTLVDGFRGAGPHRATWDGLDDAGRPVASGVYHYRLRTGGADETRKMLLLK